MVDPQPVERAVGDLREDPLVGGGEDRRVLDPQPGQRRHVEEAPVVQLLAADPPVAEPPVLRVQQLGQRELLGAGRQRQHVVVVAQPVAAPTDAARRRPGTRRASCRAPGTSTLPGLSRAVPVDVEPAGERRLPARRAARPTRPGSPIPARPTAWFGTMSSTIAEAGRAARLAQPAEPRLAAELGVDPAVVDDVVAVVGCRRSPAATASSRGARRRARPGTARRRRRRRSRSPASAGPGRCWSGPAGRAGDAGHASSGTGRVGAPSSTAAAGPRSTRALDRHGRRRGLKLRVLDLRRPAAAAVSTRDLPRLAVLLAPGCVKSTGS